MLWPRAASASPAPYGPRAGAEPPRGRAGPAGESRERRGAPLSVNRKPGWGGEERRPRNFPPRLERRRPGSGLALADRRRRSWCQSPLRAPAGPPPPPAPPLPPVNGQRWSLNRALNHLNAICAPGPHLLPPTAARSVLGASRHDCHALPTTGETAAARGLPGSLVVAQPRGASER